MSNTYLQQVAALRQRYAAEQQAAASVPEHVQAWLSEHQDYLRDPVKSLELQLASTKAVRDGKTWHDSDFVETVERHLGMRQQPPPLSPMAPPRTSAPSQSVAPRQHAGPPVSAPPTRDSPSWSTGRPVRTRVPLTAEEMEVVRASGISVEDYQRGKERRDSEKAAGLHQDGR